LSVYTVQMNKRPANHGITAAIAGTVAITKKLLPPRQPPRPDFPTRQEFHAAMDAQRDRTEATQALILTTEHRVLTTLDRQIARIDKLESTVARLDERTSALYPKIQQNQPTTNVQ
jgi:hypothetical protein